MILNKFELPTNHLILAEKLAKHDIQGRYRRSEISPFWLIISIGVMIVSIGIDFGQVFNTLIDVYLPFLEDEKLNN